MILKEALNLYQGQQIKVGAEMSFLYCEICDENIYDTIQKLSDERFAYICDRLDTYKFLYDSFEKRWKKKFKTQIDAFNLKVRNAIIKKCDKDNKFDYDKALKLKFKSKEYKEDLQFLTEQLEEKRDNEYKKIITCLARYNKYYDTWKPYLEREVLEVYDAILYDCRIIIIAGAELGKYWDKDEYNNATRCD